MTGPGTRDTRILYQVAAHALSYPDEQLRAQLPALRQALATVPQRHGHELGGLLDHLATVAPAALAAEYVETFDLRRRCCLYLSYYAYGDTRKRGLALLEFKRAYREAGLELAEDELPDHLVMVLEFAATSDLDAGKRLLSMHRAGLELLRLALVDSGSPYAAAVSAITATLPALRGEERSAVAKLAAEGPPDEAVGLEPFAPPDYMGARR